MGRMQERIKQLNEEIAKLEQALSELAAKRDAYQLVIDDLGPDLNDVMLTHPLQISIATEDETAAQQTPSYTEVLRNSQGDLPDPFYLDDAVELLAAKDLGQIPERNSVSALLSQLAAKLEIFRLPEERKGKAMAYSFHRPQRGNED